MSTIAHDPCTLCGVHMIAWPGSKVDAEDVENLCLCDACVPVYLDWLCRAAPEKVDEHAKWFDKFGHGISGVTQSQRALADVTFVNPWAN